MESYQETVAAYCKEYRIYLHSQTNKYQQENKSSWQMDPILELVNYLNVQVSRTTTTNEICKYTGKYTSYDREKQPKSLKGPR